MHDFTLRQSFLTRNNITNPQKYWLSNPANKETTDKKNKKQKALITGGIVIGGVMLLSSKGVQKNSKKWLEKLRDYLETKLDGSFLNEKTPKQSFYGYTIRKLDSFIRKTESINNFNSMKDILFMKIMYKTNPTKKIHMGITKFFEYLSRNTVKKSYQKTQKYFDQMYEKFDKLDEYILAHPSDEIFVFKKEEYDQKGMVAKAKDCRESVKLIVSAFMMEQTQQIRYEHMKKVTSQLYSSFWDESFKGFWTKDNKFRRKEMWQTFIAAEQIKTSKTDLAYNVAFARQVLSFRDEEKKSYLTGYIQNLDSLISVNDEVGADIIKRLKWYLKDASNITKHQKNILREIDRLENHNIAEGLKEDVAKNRIANRDKTLSLMRRIVTENGTGELQDMLDIYYKIAPFELARSGTLKSVQKAVSSFDKSVRLEVEEFFDKLRDLEIGSAPTDILTVLISTGMILYSLNKAKNNEEKSSIMLKSGIPIIGAVATSLISATKLISGGKSIAFGFISGIILNRLGVFVDDLRKGSKI